MNIYYQGNPGSYMHIASIDAQQHIYQKIDNIIGMPDFQSVWEQIDEFSLGILAIENSYMGSIHPNLYNFLKFPNKVIVGEIEIPINHCLCSKEKSIDRITTIYSQQPALDQCYNYINKHKFTRVAYGDTALSAKFVAESGEKGLGAIASEKAAEIYGLHILEKSIQDNTSNTTRFIIIKDEKNKIEYSDKVGKVSLFFEVKHIPSSLYKCLGAFATNNINLTKIESLPSYKNKFQYMFWITFEGSLDDKNVQQALEELEFFTHSIRILGEY